MVYFTNTNGFITFEIYKTKVMENEEKNTVAEDRAKYGRVDVIAEWKRRRAEDESKFDKWLKSPEKEEVLKDLRRRNAANGVIIP